MIIMIMLLSYDNIIPLLMALFYDTKVPRSDLTMWRKSNNFDTNIRKNNTMKL